jgi:hypothetical protein
VPASLAQGPTSSLHPNCAVISKIALRSFLLESPRACEGQSNVTPWKSPKRKLHLFLVLEGGLDRFVIPNQHLNSSINFVFPHPKHT